MQILFGFPLAIGSILCGALLVLSGLLGRTPFFAGFMSQYAAQVQAFWRTRLQLIGLGVGLMLAGGVFWNLAWSDTFGENANRLKHEDLSNALNSTSDGMNPPQIAALTELLEKHEHPEDQAIVLAKIANCHFGRDENEETLIQAEKAIAADSNCSYAYSVKARCLYGLGRYDALVAVCDEGLAIPDPYTGWTYNFKQEYNYHGRTVLYWMRGQAFARKDKTESAIEDLTKACKRKHPFRSWRFAMTKTLGWVHFNARRYNDLLRTADELEPLSESSDLAYGFRGLAYLGLGEPAKAEQEFDKFRGDEREPLYGWQQGIAKHLATADDPGVRNGRLAVKYAEAAHRSAGDKDPCYVETLAKAYACAERYEDAVRMQKKVLSLKPEDAEAAKRLAEWTNAAKVSKAESSIGAWLASHSFSTAHHRVLEFDVEGDLLIGGRIQHIQEKDPHYYGTITGGSIDGAVVRFQIEYREESYEGVLTRKNSQAFTLTTTDGKEQWKAEGRVKRSLLAIPNTDAAGVALAHLLQGGPFTSSVHRHMSFKLRGAKILGGIIHHKEKAVSGKITGGTIDGNIARFTWSDEGMGTALIIHKSAGSLVMRVTWKGKAYEHEMQPGIE